MAFREYLDAVDMRAAQVCDDATCDERSRVSLQNILETTGVPLEQAKKHATIIQAAFRGHYERMLLNESRGMIQWQRAATRTLEILRKAGASQAEASKAAIIIQATYRGYYTRRNLKMKMKEEKKSQVDMIESKEPVQAVAWLDMMYEDSGLTPTRANEAASVIQKVFDEVMARADIPMEFGNREDLAKAGEKLQRAFKDRLMRARIAEEEYEDEPIEEESDESFEKLVNSIDVAEDWQEGREIEVKSERDEETDAYVQD